MIQEFWTNAKLDFWKCESCLTSKIQGQRVIVCEEDLREALNLNDDPKDPKEFTFMDQRKCFLRMKYNGPITDGSLHKGKLCPQFKYLAHVLIHVFGSAAGGFDLMRKSISSMMVALILNKPFNVSGMLMDHLLEPVNGTRTLKFLLYPRFLQMVFDNKYKNLKKDPTHIVVQEHMTLNTLARMKAYKGLSANERPPVRRLFGHLARLDYEDPGEELVRHDDSNSDTDDPLHHIDPDAKRKRQIVNVGAKGGKMKKKEVVLNVVEPEKEKSKSVPRRQKSKAQKGLHLVDEVSIDSEETQEDERWNSEAETVETTLPKATEPGASADAEVQGDKSPIQDEVIEVILNMDDIEAGSPVQAKKKKKQEKPSLKRKKELEMLMAGKNLPPATSSKSPVAEQVQKK